jgi:putative membrane protein
MSHPWKGSLAGVVGGLLGSYLMSKVHSVVQEAVSAPQPQGEDSTVKAASALSRLILRKDLTPKQKEMASPLIHYAFGASIGAVYGAAAEFTPAVSAGWGTLFGISVWLGAHVIAVPALGFSEPVTRYSMREGAPELAAHIVYGSTVEFVRRSVSAL